METNLQISENKELTPFEEQLLIEFRQLKQGILSTKEYQKKITEIDKMLAKIPGAKFGDYTNLRHEFEGGMYRRTIYMRKGDVLTSKIHKHDHFFVIVKGKLIVLDEKGEHLITAPYHGITKSGTKRLLMILEDTVWTTYHLNPKGLTNPDDLEDDIIAKDFDEIPLIEGEILPEQKLIEGE
jgi:hypothetical protein